MSWAENLKRLDAAIVLCVVALAAAGCGEDAPPPRPNAAPQAQAVPTPPRPQATAVAAESAKAVSDSESGPAPGEVVVKRFRPVRDPFKSVFATKQIRAVSDGISHPLQQYSIGQLRLLGIIWGIASPVALVATPGGDEYIIKTGTPVGTGDGKVVAILPDRVVIVERYYDYRGQLQTEKYELVLANEGK